MVFLRSQPDIAVPLNCTSLIRWREEEDILGWSSKRINAESFNNSTIIRVAIHQVDTRSKQRGAAGTSLLDYHRIAARIRLPSGVLLEVR